MLKKFDMLKLKSINTPMSPSTKLDADEKGKSVDQKLYRGVIGSLLYLTTSRPNIQFSECLCARLQSQLKESHLIIVKRIFRYLLDTQTLGIWYPRESSFSLIGYSDVDFAGSKTDRKSTSGTCQFPGSMLVSWSSFSDYFDEMKLKKFSTFKNKTYSASLVKEFYASIALDENELEDLEDFINDGLNVFLNGKEFVVTAADLGSLLKIECKEGDYEILENYDPSSLWEIITRKKKRYSSKSNADLIKSPHIRILHYFIAANIHGRSGSFSYISLQDMWLMEHASNAAPINLGQFMIERMRRAYRIDKVNLSYGNTITKLVKKKGMLM
ncbi:hypothetical protein QQP08_004257 [Theobroma cacao]|nr:hypothetical protein QQP08_004257 [Theobroma cacao]